MIIDKPKAKTTKVLPPSVIRGCPIKMLPNEERLNKENLVRTRVNCFDKKDNLVKDECLARLSFVTYKCKDGYIFENLKSNLFNANTVV